VRRTLATALALLGLIALIAAPADATKKHRHKPSGVKGVVLDASCYGACVEPPPPDPIYSGAVTVTVSRASDGSVVASQAVSDGHFRIRVKRGVYDVSSVPPNPPTCQPTPTTVCPLDTGPPSDVMIAPCLQGETKRVQVRRHRFTRVELHVTNVCIV
jgi:hypothetical protein